MDKPTTVELEFSSHGYEGRPGIPLPPRFDNPNPNPKSNLDPNSNPNLNPNPDPKSNPNPNWCPKPNPNWNSKPNPNPNPSSNPNPNSNPNWIHNTNPISNPNWNPNPNPNSNPSPNSNPNPDWNPNLNPNPISNPNWNTKPNPNPKPSSNPNTNPNPIPNPSGIVGMERAFPSNSLSLKTREISALSLKRIFDQIHSSTASGLQSANGNPNYKDVSSRPSMHPPRPSCPPSSQLTIFYSGSVNVYDDVPADKAHAIMLLAGSSQGLPQSGSTPAKRSSVAARVVTLPMSSAATLAPPVVLPPLPIAPDGSPNMAPVSPPVTETKPPQLQPSTKNCPQSELPHARKASLARFLEKRKERVLTKAFTTEKSGEGNDGLLAKPMEKPTLKRPLSRPSSPSARSHRSSPSPALCEEEEE